MAETEGKMSKAEDTWALSQSGYSPFHGISLRDWFAGMALQGHIASDTMDFNCNEEMHAKYAYRCADAMLKAREEIK